MVFSLYNATLWGNEPYALVRSRQKVNKSFMFSCLVTTAVCSLFVLMCPYMSIYAHIFVFSKKRIQTFCQYTEEISAFDVQERFYSELVERLCVFLFRDTYPSVRFQFTGNWFLLQIVFIIAHSCFRRLWYLLYTRYDTPSEDDLSDLTISFQVGIWCQTRLMEVN